MKNLTERCSNGLKNVSDQLAVLTDRYTQKIKSIDDEMHDHQTKLDGLNESFANVSSHVNSIESEWPKFKQSNQQLDATVTRVNNDVQSLKINVGNLNSTIRDLLALHGVKKAQDVKNVSGRIFCSIKLILLNEVKGKMSTTKKSKISSVYR